MRKLGIDEIKNIATEAFKTNFDLRSLSPEERQRVAVGYTVEGGVAICSFYIPAPRPHDGKLMAEIKVDRTTGHVISTHIL